MTTREVRRDAVRPGDVLRSSFGFRVLVTEVKDNAAHRSDDRHVEIVGHLHADPANRLHRERAEAGGMVTVEREATR